MVNKKKRKKKREKVTFFKITIKFTWANKVTLKKICDRIREKEPYLMGKNLSELLDIVILM